MTTIFDGRSFAQKKEELLKPQMVALTKKLGRKPKLLAVGIGSEKDIEMYLRMKQKAADRIGADFEMVVFDIDANECKILEIIGERNADKDVDGILLELPIPKRFDDTKIMEQISPQKDPDCMTYENLGRLLYGKPRVLPATVRAIRDILEYYFNRHSGDERSEDSRIKNRFWTSQNDEDRHTVGKLLAYKNAVVVGGGVELGKPLVMWLSDMGAAVSLCRSTTRDLSEYTKNADIIISAAGVPNLIKGNMVKNGVVVVDAGINFVNGKTAGDVEFESVSPKASFITPVPGGVGPVTIISLFENLGELIGS